MILYPSYTVQTYIVHSYCSESQYSKCVCALKAIQIYSTGCNVFSHRMINYLLIRDFSVGRCVTPVSSVARVSFQSSLSVLALGCKNAGPAPHVLVTMQTGSQAGRGLLAFPYLLNQ